ncbi:MAG: hypothetical protein AB8F34_02230 [Akkermansiaceae bacterium]
MIRFLIFTILCAGCLTSCAYLRQFIGSNPKVVMAEKDVRLAGRVERVDTAGGYVLIRRYGPWRFDASEEVAESRAEGRTANLLPTGEKLGEHIAADIRSGEVEVGDAVYIRLIKASRKPETSSNPEKLTPSDNQLKPAGNP